MALTMLITIFEIVSPLFLIALVGYVYGARVNPDMATVNRLVMDIFMPALILKVMWQDGFNVADYGGLMLSGFAVIFLSGIAAFTVARAFGFAWRAFVPPAMFSNWANLGLPLYVFALGSNALNGGVMLVALGNLVCFTVGILIYAGRVRLREVLTTPVLIAVAVGWSVSSFDVPVPSLVEIPLSMLGDVVIPLMLFSLGVRLNSVTISDSKQALVMAVLCPVVGTLVALGAASVIPMTEVHRNILLLFGALPPAVVNFILAEQYQQNPEQVASMIMIGNLFSIVSIPVVLYLFVL